MDLEFYLDNAATTPAHPDVVERCLPLLSARFGNPSSLHREGLDARRELQQARERLARLLGVPPQGVTFTSGGTEADNLALLGAFASKRHKGERLLVSAIEHPAVLQAAAALERQGVTVHHIPVTRQGVVDLAALERLLGPDVRMVSCMAVNNELGTAQPLEEIGRLMKRAAPRALFHVDAVQAFAKQPLPWREARMDLISLSAHKVHGPKGAGALVRCRPVHLEPMLHGGGQEDGLRSGTENPFGAAAFSMAAERTAAWLQRQAVERREYHRRWLAELDRYPSLRVFRSERATPYIVQFSYPPIPGEVVLNHLEQEGLLVSTGSACSTRKPEPSHVLLAVGLPEKEAVCSVRLSFSVHNSVAGMAPVLAGFARAMARLERL
jgi:cysteine desulfurase